MTMPDPAPVTFIDGDPDRTPLTSGQILAMHRLGRRNPLRQADQHGLIGAENAEA